LKFVAPITAVARLTGRIVARSGDASELLVPASGIAHSGAHGEYAFAGLERMYGHPVYFAETFIDPGHFRGTCYRGANWKLLGLTTGRGKDSTGKRPNRSLKEVLGYPLTPHFRDLLSRL
jgi:hypothetical protein